MLEESRPDVPDGERENVRCQFGLVPGGSECGLPGEVRILGFVLCSGHASRMYLEDRIAALRAVVLQLELCIEAGERGRLSGTDVGSLMARRERARARLEAAKRAHRGLEMDRDPESR